MEVLCIKPAQNFLNIVVTVPPMFLFIREVKTIATKKVLMSVATTWLRWVREEATEKIFRW